MTISRLIVKFSPCLAVTSALLLVLNSPSAAQDAGGPPPVPFEQTVQDYKAKIEASLAGLSAKEATKGEKGAAAFSTSYFFEGYDQFIKGIDTNHLEKLKADANLMEKLCSLHLAYADYQLEDAKIEATPPLIASLEKAFKEYQSAYDNLAMLTNRTIAIQQAKRIDDGLAKTITGLNKYASWFAKDAFMNPDGKTWDANPAPAAEKLRSAVATLMTPPPPVLSEVELCQQALEQVLKDIQKAIDLKDNTAALDKMILGARWLTTILQKYPDVFIKEFRTYNQVTRPAMEEIKKSYSPEKMKDFSRFYEPLKSHYLNLTKQ